MIEIDISTYERELAEHGRIIRTNKGTSMMPLLREGRDVMIIERPGGRLKKYDVPLYKRPDGAYVLHRILKVRESDYIICGDNLTRREYGITDNDIIGVLVGVIRNGKTISTSDISYRLYTHLWCDFFYIRVAILSVKSFAVRALRYIKRKLTGSKK